MVLELLRKRLTITDDAVRDGIRDLVVPGRFQVIPGDVTLILDVAHNPAAAVELAANLGAMPGAGRNLALFSAMGDKDIAEVVVPLAGLIDRWYIGQIDLVRAASLEQLRRAITAAGVDERSIDIHKSLSQAAAKAMADAVAHDKLIVFGSFYTVAEIMQHPDINKIRGEACG
jgi:dihydrofolate synthase/folylpolyglutamate synthase